MMVIKININKIIDNIVMIKDYNFNVEKVTAELIQWCKDWFDQNGPNANAVIGMSGGKDSTIAAAILCKALGSKRVIGVLLPSNGQGLNDADMICDYLNMEFYCIPIGPICNEFENRFENRLNGNIKLSDQTIQNIPPRVRMTALYGVAQSLNGRVVNTCNLSEDYIGYATKFGDAAGDFSLFANLTVTEILAIGDYLGLPEEWVHKTPDDGLPCSSPDEEKFGFTYAELDMYLRRNVEPVGHCHNNEDEPQKVVQIENMHKWNLHKLNPMPAFNPSI